jgi:hypothetical protein
MSVVEGAPENPVLNIKVSPELAALAERFLLEADGLAQVSPPNFNVGMHWEFEPVPKMSFNVSATPAECAAMVHKLRPFVLAKEPLFVPTFLNRFKEENRTDHAQAAAKTMRDMFLVRTLPFSVATQDGEVDFEKLWQLYANAFEYHRDEKQKLELEARFAAGRAGAEFLFWAGVSTKAKAVLDMRGFAAVLAGKKTRFQVTIHTPKASAA